MPIFLGIHKLLPEMNDNDVRKGYEDYKKSATEAGLKPLGAITSIEKGFAYCQTEADNAEQIKRAHSKVGIPLEDVIKVTSLT